jgi:hypothetical protein
LGHPSERRVGNHRPDLDNRRQLCLRAAVRKYTFNYMNEVKKGET